jgi:hypothetical protein
LISRKKEANKIEGQPLDVARQQTFVNMEKIKQKILALTLEKARKIEIKHRSTLKRIKDKTKKEGRINASYCMFSKEITYPCDGIFSS